MIKRNLLALGLMWISGAIIGVTTNILVNARRYPSS